MGAYVLEKWNLPEDLITAVMLHHTFAFPDPENIYQQNMTAITSLADLICVKLGIGTRAAMEELDLNRSQAARILELDENRLNLITESVAENYMRDKGYFVA